MIEIFDWVDEDASRRAHQRPAVSEVWESMGPLCESSGGRPAFEFPAGYQYWLRFIEQIPLDAEHG